MNCRDLIVLFFVIVDPGSYMTKLWIVAKDFSISIPTPTVFIMFIPEINLATEFRVSSYELWYVGFSIIRVYNVAHLDGPVLATLKLKLSHVIDS